MISQKNLPLFAYLYIVNLAGSYKVFYSPLLVKWSSIQISV